MKGVSFPPRDGMLSRVEGDVDLKEALRFGSQQVRETAHVVESRGARGRVLCPDL